MTQWLEEFGDQIEVVFANNDDMALGAIDACLAGGNGPRPLWWGWMPTPPALEAVAEGTLQGTVLNDAQGQAREMLDLACDLAEGTAPQVEDGHYVWLEYSAVTRETLEAASARSGRPRGIRIPAPERIAFRGRFCAFMRENRATDPDRNPGCFEPVRADRGATSSGMVTMHPRWRARSQPRHTRCLRRRPGPAA